MFSLLLWLGLHLGGGWAPTDRCLFTTPSLGTAPADSSIWSQAPYSKSPRIQISRWYFALWLFHIAQVLCSTNQQNNPSSQMQLQKKLPSSSHILFGCFVTWIPPRPQQVVWTHRCPQCTSAGLSLQQQGQEWAPDISNSRFTVQDTRWRITPWNTPKRQRGCARPC